MRLSWVIWVGHKSNDNCPRKKTHAQRRGHMEPEADTGVCSHKPRKARSCQKLEKARTEPSQGM